MVAEKRELDEQHARSEELVTELTRRERAVLTQLATHLTYAEIARALFVSVNTVKTHVAHVYAKLGVSRRSDAVERAAALGIVETGAS